MENNSQITLVQKPVIQHKLVEIGKSVTTRLAGLNLPNLLATDDTIKSLKNLRIELNKELGDYEAQRKAIKEAVSNPYVEFNAIYTIEVSEKYKVAIETLKDKIAVFEDRIKLEKKNNVICYFNELCFAESIDFLKFENVGLEINLSTSEKAYKDKCNEFVQKVSDDILLINTQEFEAEIMAEYKKTLNASKAITAIVERKAAIKLEADRIKQAETNRRQSLLRGLSMAYYDLTKTFNWVQDDNVNIKQSDIENLSKEDFQKRFVELEAKTKIVIVAPVIEAVLSVNVGAPSLFPNNAPPFTQMTNGVASNVPVEIKQVAAPISAPVIEATPKPTFTASFECVGTMAQLKAIGQYMKENNIIYKNI